MSIIDIKLKRGDYIIVNRDYDFSNLSNPDLSKGRNVIPKGTIFKIEVLRDSYLIRKDVSYNYSVDKLICTSGNYEVPPFLSTSDLATAFNYYTREINLNKLLDEHCR